MTQVIDNDFHPEDRLENDADQGHWGTKLAGDVVPIRPPGAPENNAGRQNQIKNQQRQRPSLDDPKISRIYG